MALRISRTAGLLLLGGLAMGSSGMAQSPTPLKVGDPAPDFTLPAANASGVQPKPLRLSDLKDQTVVIAFFYKARTSG